MGWAERMRAKFVTPAKKVEALDDSMGPTGRDEAFVLGEQSGPIMGTIGFLAHETGRYSATWYDLWRLELPGPVKMLVKYSANIAQARNEIVEHAEGDWIFWVDDDHRFPAHLLKSLLARREAIIQPLVLKRYPPFDALLFGPEDPSDPGHHWTLALEPGHEGLRPVHAIGAGMSLVRMFVYRGMEKPHYRYGEASPTNLGEDLGFCRRARAAGFRAYMDLDNPVGHLNTVEVWPFRDDDGEWQIALYMGGVLVARFPFAESKCLVSPDGNVISGEPGRAWVPAVVKGGKS